MKKILLLMFFTLFLKAEAQENRFEISLGLGPIYYLKETPKAGIDGNTKIGYKVNNVLTVFAGGELLSFPLKDEVHVFPPKPDSVPPGFYPKSVKVTGRRERVSAGFIGGRVNIMSQKLFSPYVTTNVGFYTSEQTEMVFEPDWRWIEEGDISFQYCIVIGGGVNLNIDNDKSLFLEISRQGIGSRDFVSLLFGTRLSF